MKKKITTAYAGIQGSYSMIFGGIGSFASVYLLSEGFSNSEIGLCISIANLLAVLIQPVLADVADRSEKIELTDIIFGIGFVMLGAMLMMFWVHGHGMFLFVLFVLALAAHGLFQPFLNALNHRFLKMGQAINYGLCRSAGSVGFSIVTAILGPLVTLTGNNSILIVSVICLFLLMVFNFVIHRILSTQKGLLKSGTRKKAISLFHFVKQNRLFLILNLGVALVFYHVHALGAFLFQLIEPIGGTKADMGLLFSLMAIVEVPAMVMYSRLQKKYGSQKMLLLSLLGFVIKFFIFTIASQVWMIYFSQLFQMVSYAVFYPAMVMYITEIMDEGEAVRGQALFTVMMMVSAVLSNISGGYILDHFGVSVFTKIALGCCVLGALIAALMIRKIELPKT